MKDKSKSKNMTHLEYEINELKDEIVNMWTLVVSQLKKTHKAIITNDEDLAREVLVNEKRVDALELKIDLDCENIIALFNPVAIDLRFVLASLKINNNLERIADMAKGIAKLIIKENVEFDKNLIEKSEVNVMFEEAIDMLNDLQYVFDTQDTKQVRKIFKRDEILNLINSKIDQVIVDFIKENPNKIEHALDILTCVKKLERVGDQCTNIAEELIFFIEAKVLKHRNKRKLKEIE